MLQSTSYGIVSISSAMFHAVSTRSPCRPMSTTSSPTCARGTLVTSMLTFAGGRTNILQGTVHLGLFLAYLLLIFIP